MAFRVLCHWAGVCMYVYDYFKVLRSAFLKSCIIVFSLQARLHGEANRCRNIRRKNEQQKKKELQA